MQLDENTITFGKYKDKDFKILLKDRKYCEWLVKQEWFKNNYEYLYNKVSEYNPKNFFHTKPEYKTENVNIEHFIMEYPYFYLKPLEDLKINLSEDEKICYKFYIKKIEELKNQIGDNINPFDIKAPKSWLKKFEDTYKIKRETFKDFLNSNELPNIPYIIEDIKKQGGLIYKGAKSYLIAKEKSLIQEKFWENILKKYYGEDIGTQYKFKNCFFDFINIKLNTLYECKLGIKDFNKKQYDKYCLTLGTYKFIYLISTDCIIDIDKKTLFTIDKEKYLNEINSKDLIKGFQIKILNSIEDFFKD